MLGVFDARIGLKSGLPLCKESNSANKREHSTDKDSWRGNLAAKGPSLSVGGGVPSTYLEK